MPNRYVKGEPPNRTRTPKEGDRRTVRLMTNPPKMAMQIFKGGRWVVVKDNMPKKKPKTINGATPAPMKTFKPKGKSVGRGGSSKGMSLNDAIKSMQRDKPWN